MKKDLTLWIEENCPELAICNHSSKIVMLKDHTDINPLIHYKFYRIIYCPVCNKLYFGYAEIRISPEDFILITDSISIDN